MENRRIKFLHTLFSSLTFAFSSIPIEGLTLQCYLYSEYLAQLQIILFSCRDGRTRWAVVYQPSSWFLQSYKFGQSASFQGETRECMNKFKRLVGWIFKCFEFGSFVLGHQTEGFVFPWISCLLPALIIDLHSWKKLSERTFYHGKLSHLYGASTDILMQRTFHIWLRNNFKLHS